MRLDDWFLTAEERGNPATRLDRRHADGLAWTTGNEVTALVHGSSYFPELRRCVDQTQRGDLLMFTDWRGDPDQRIDYDGARISDVFAAAAERGVIVKGLVWRSHVDRLSFSEQENRHLGEDINAAGGECLRDMRVRPGGSHHQKFVVLRHLGRPALDVAFVGGIDLCHSRFDGPEHHGDPQRQPMADVYGNRPPWHDVQVRIQGPAVGDVEAVFRDMPYTRWAFDTRRRVLFSSDGFAHTHGHSARHCGLLAEEALDTLDLDEMTAFYAFSAFHWTQHVDVEPMISRLEQLLGELDVDIVAPTHGLPFSRLDLVVPEILKGFRLGSERGRDR